MTRTLMHAAYEGTHNTPGSQSHPKYSRTAQRLREHRQWSRDWFTESASEHDEWVDLSIAYAYARMGLRVPAFDELSEGDCDRFGCSGNCLKEGGSGHCRYVLEEGASW